MAFPMTGVLDNFTRSNSTTTLGANWTLDSNINDITGILSNQAYEPNPNNNSSLVYWNTKYNGQIEAYFTLPVLTGVGASNTFISAWTDQSSLNGYSVAVNATSAALLIHKWTAGSPALQSTFVQAFSAGDSAGIRITTAGVISAWYQSGSGSYTSLGTFSDSAFICHYIGMLLQDQTVRIGKFGGGSSFAFRKTFSGIGSATGKRQVMGWSQ